MKFRILLFLFLPFFVNAQIAPDKLGPELITFIQQNYTPSSTLGYGPARDILYSEIDNVGNDLSGIYTDFTVTLNPNDDPSQSAFQNGAGINAEHVYPQSKGAGDEPQRSDLHHVFPSKVDVNAARGSCPFDDVEDSDTDNWFYLAENLTSIPSSDIDNYSESDEEGNCRFEPRESVKGDIARAMFYFYTIYRSAANGADPNFFELQKMKLFEWHNGDPVDAKERRRDSLINVKQGNHNPFILDATAIQRAYFPTTSVDQIKKEDWVSIAANLVQNEVVISSKKENGNVLLYNLTGQLVLKKNLTQETVLSIYHLPNAPYILQVRSESKTQVFRIFKR